MSLGLLAARGSYACGGFKEACVDGFLRSWPCLAFLLRGSLRELVLVLLGSLQTRLSLWWVSMDLLCLRESEGVCVGWPCQDVVVLGTPRFLVRSDSCGCDERCIFPVQCCAVR